MGDRLTKERESEIRRVVDKMGFHPTPALVRDLLAELDAVRAERDEWERDATRLDARCRRQDEQIAETRAQLARLREAASGLLSSARDAIVASWDARLDDRDRGGVVIDRAAYARLAASVTLHVDALSTPGPTLAEIERSAVVRELRNQADGLDMGGRDRRREVAWAASVIRQRADDLEAGRG